MHIVVFGAGAVGGYFGGRLAKAGTPVTFLVRERRYNQLSNRGLNIRSIHGDFTVTPRLALSAGDIEDPDVVIVGLKNYHLEGAWPDLRVLVQKGAAILPLMNGVQHLDQLVREFGEASVFGGVCYIESTLDATVKWCKRARCTMWYLARCRRPLTLCRINSKLHSTQVASTFA